MLSRKVQSPSRRDDLGLLGPEIINPSWRLIPLQTCNPFLNMAVDELLFRNRCDYSIEPMQTIRFYRWKPSAVSIGRHQELHNEVDIEACNKLGISVVRRISGGGAVFHMFEGEVTYSVVGDFQSLRTTTSTQVYQRILSALSLGLQKLGVLPAIGEMGCPAVFVGRKKISGNAQAVSGNVFLQHGTFLVDYDPHLMYTVLKARPNQLRTKMVQSVYSRVTTLRSEAISTDFDFLTSILTEAFKEEFQIPATDFIISPLTQEEIEQAERLARTRYKSPLWTEMQEETELIPTVAGK